MSIKELNIYCKTKNRAILVNRGLLVGFFSEKSDWYCGDMNG